MAQAIGLDTIEELGCLLRLNHDLVQALEGKKLRDKRLRYSEGLVWKLFVHAATALHLVKNGTKPNIPDLEINFVDWASIQILARACAEVVIAFDYVFCEPTTDDEAEFRYLAWMLVGFVKRESFPVQTPEGKQQIAKDVKINAQMRGRIQKTVAFQALTERQKKTVLQGKNWHPNTSLSTMSQVVFGSLLGGPMYSFMSSHAHADALSSVQILQTGKNATYLAEVALLKVTLAVARMSKIFAEKWVAARRVYGAHRYHELNEAYLSFRDFDPEAGT